MMRSYLKENDVSIKNGTDVNAVMRDMMSVILEDALEEELDDESRTKYSPLSGNGRNARWKKSMRSYLWMPSIPMSAARDAFRGRICKRC